MRVAFILLITGIGIAAAVFINAFYGLLLYAFYAFASPLELTWGALEGSRLSFVVAALVIITALMQKQKIIFKHSIVFLSITFLFFCYISLAVKENIAPFYWDQLYLLARVITMALVASAMIDDARKLRLYILAIAVFIGFLGAYYGIFGLFAGSTDITGPGRIGDNNGFSAWLVTALPFIYYSGLQLKKKSWRILSKIIFIGNIIAIMLTFSRGGFVALVVVLALLFFTIKRNIIIFALIAACLFIFLLPSVDYSYKEEPLGKEEVEQMDVVDKTAYQYQERIKTLRKPKKEISSAVSRIHCWRIAIDMAEANQLFGVGFARYKAEYDNYDTSHGEYGPKRAVHNTILSVLAETGYLGFSVFIFLVFICWITIIKAKRKVMQISDIQLRKEFLSYTKMLNISLIAYFLAGSFVNTLFQEIFWAIITVSIVMDKISQMMLEGPSRKAKDTIDGLSQFLFGR